MDLNEQEKGILTGIALTVIAFYAFNFFSSPQVPSEIIEQQEKLEQTHADKFLNEPLGLYTGVEKIEDGKSTRLKNKRRRKKVAKRKKNESRNKNAAIPTKTDQKHANKNKKDDEEKKEEDNENTDTVADNPHPTEEKYNNDSPQSSGIAGISGSLHMPHTPEKNDTTTEFDTIEEWIAYFVNAQALSSIDKFTNAYLSQEISGELFYGVIEELLTNFRTKLKHYGIIALNKTPSPESFDHLVHIIESDHHEQAVQNRTAQGFNMYTHPNYVGTIINTLSSPKDGVRLKAIQVAVKSAQINLRANDNPASREPQSRQRTLSQGNNIDKYTNFFSYQSLKIKLESMAQQDHNSTVRSQAEQAVNIISDLLQQPLT